MIPAAPGILEDGLKASFTLCKAALSALNHYGSSIPVIESIQEMSFRTVILTEDEIPTAERLTPIESLVLLACSLTLRRPLADRTVRKATSQSTVAQA
jgi:hypothetical protein